MVVVMKNWIMSVLIRCQHSERLFGFDISFLKSRGSIWFNFGREFLIATLLSVCLNRLLISDYYIMSFHMCPHISWFREHFTTMITFIWFFTSVPADMYFKGAWPHKLSSTMFARIRSLIFVSTRVVSQVTLCGESFPAALLWAHKRLLSRVYSFVSL